MAQNRDHHFVSQFYLRKFSADDSSICMLNIGRGRFVPTASIKGQCASPHFYGPDDSIDSGLRELETHCGAVILRILETGKLPAPDSEDMAGLLVFIVMQRSRAQAAAQANDLMTDYLAKLHLEGRDGLTEADLDRFEIRNQYPSAVPVSVAADIAHQAFDLGAHLLTNDTAVDFITSDEPVVAHNQFCEGVRHRGVCGWRSTGLQILWPISPRALILLFDKQIYKVGARKGPPVMAISNAADVHQLNAFQILNATHNVYFQNPADAERLGPQVREVAKRRRKKRWHIVRARRDPDESGESDELMHFYESLLPQTLAISGIGVRRRMRQASTSMRVNMKRGEPLATGPRMPRPGEKWTRYKVISQK